MPRTKVPLLKVFCTKLFTNLSAPNSMKCA